MQIYIQVKQLGKRKASIEAQKFIIEDSLFTVHDLLYDIVTKQVDKFNHRAIGNIDDEPTLLNYLSLTQIENQSPSGKISSGKTGGAGNGCGNRMRRGSEKRWRMCQTAAVARGTAVH